MSKSINKSLSMFVCIIMILSISLSSQIIYPQKVDATTVPETMLPNYNVTWTSPSSDIKGSMPIGNGKIGALVWATSGGDLMVQLAMGDSWDENARTIKLGNIRIKTTPNPFASGQPFSQILKYKEGEIVITAGSNPSITYRIWVDANTSVVHVESNAGSNYNMEVSSELWRTSTKQLTSLNWSDFIHVATFKNVPGTPTPVYITADTVPSVPNKLEWYHRNDTSHWGETMTTQSIDSGAFGVNDPLTYRTSGALVQGTNLVTSSANKLVSSEAGTNFRVDIACHTKVAPNLADWQNELNTISDTTWNEDIETLRTNHQTYWGNFWNKSYMFVTGDANADKVTNGYIAARYLQACQGRAEGPIGFTGGLFGFNNDVLQWHDYTQFNMRFAYWNMLQSGDFDLMQSYFDMNINSIPVAKAKTSAMWGHSGIILPEHMILYGPQSGTCYGWDRTGKNVSYLEDAWTRLLYTGTLEIGTMMLDYYDYTQDTSFVTNKLLPFCKEVVVWYDQHWGRDSNGKINMYPIYSGEGDRTCQNPMTDVGGLTKIVNGLLALPTTLTTQTDRDYWTSIKNQLPVLPVYGGRLNTAQNLLASNSRDSNNQNLYAIFPYNYYCYGKPDLQIAIDSYNNRKGKYPTTSTDAWRHDATHASYLGMTDEAKYQTVAALGRNTNGNRYIGFVNGAPDGANHCIEPLAIGKIALQAMMLHPGEGNTLNLLNAWPAEWNCKFKLWAPRNTCVEGESNGTVVTNLEVSPSSREADIVQRAIKTNAAPPIITTQPSDKIANVGDTVTLSVTASASETGTLSYQWYKNSTEGNSGGIIINGATSPSYLVPTNIADIMNYYCVVTNTDTTKTGITVATTTSSVAIVAVSVSRTVINDTSPDINYVGSFSYSANRNLGDYMNDVHQTQKNQDYFEYTFTGIGIDYIGVKNIASQLGNQDVYIDGVFDKTISAATDKGYTAQSLIYSKRGLTSGPHTIKVVKKDSSWMALDSFVVFNTPGTTPGTTTGAAITVNDTDTSTTYTGNFSYSANRNLGDYMNDVHQTTNNLDSFQYTFMGTGIDYIGVKNQDIGNQDIYIDGVLMQTISATASSYTPQAVLYSISNLAPGQHTIKVVKKSGYWMVLDMFKVIS